MKKIGISILLILCLFLLIGCNKKKEDETVDIYASIYPVYYLTNMIVRDKLVVKQVYPINADVHEYDPVADGEMRSLISMNDAKLMLYIGDGLERFIATAKTTVFSNSNLKIVSLTDNMQLIDSATDDYEERKSTHIATADYHIWLDPTIMIELARKIFEEVCLIDPDHKDYFEGNLNWLISERLEALDKKYKEALDSVEEKIMLVDHDAYAYLIKRYNIQRIKTRVNNESCDISSAMLTETLEIAKELNLKFIVAAKNETVCSSVDTYCRELDAKLVYLDPLAILSSENRDNNKDYYSVMLDNLEVLKEIFGVANEAE